MRALAIACIALLLAAPLGNQTPRDAAAPASSEPQLPRARVELPPEGASGQTVHVAAGGSLQAALDAAKPGDRITLAPGAVYEGPFRLPKKNGDGWITITTAAPALPARGTRVSPADAATMPRLVAASRSVIEAMPGAHHYRLVGLEITPTPGTYLTSLVTLGESERTVDEQPHHLVIERSYLHGDRAKGARRGVALNARHAAVVDSYLSDFKERAADAQAILGWNGAGPFLIANNYLEASGENVMFGGADPVVPNLVPADIEIVRNHMAKPLRWKPDQSPFEGPWAVKNLFELKNARRVLVDGNVFEYNWENAQNGFAILFTVRNQDGKAPWSVVEDVTFTHNVVRHVGGGVNILGRDDIHTSQQTRRIAIRHNLFLDVGGRWGAGRLFQLLEGTADVRIEHNTALQSGSVLFGGDQVPHTGFVFANNVAPHNEHGITGSGTAAGEQTLARYFPRAEVRGNVFVGGNAGAYPAGNAFVGSLEDAGLAVLKGGGLRALGATPAAAAPEAGADLAVLLQKVRGVAPLDAEERAAAAAAAAAAREGVPAAALMPEPVPVSDRLAAGVFWLALALLVFVYAGYPLIAVLRARLAPRPVRRTPIEPTVSIVLVAHNEGTRIDARIENLLALEYPRDRVEILVGSDGSTDNTVARARAYEALGVRVHAFPQRRGKPAGLNALVAAARGEIVLFADARQRFTPDALRVLVANFADPAVGAVSGELMLEAADGGAAGSTFYWRYEKAIRSAESRLDSTVGATGAIYALRRELFAPIPEDTLLDDVLIPLRAVQQGKRVLFEPAAHAYDVAAPAAQEKARKVRTIAGTFQLLARERWLWLPWRNRLWFATMSHKALRLAIPVLQAAVLAANLALVDVWPYQWLLAGQALFYGAAFAGSRRRGARRPLLLTVPDTLCLLTWCTVVGFWRFLTNAQPVTWQMTMPQVAEERTPARAA